LSVYAAMTFRVTAATQPSLSLFSPLYSSHRVFRSILQIILLPYCAVMLCLPAMAALTPPRAIGMPDSSGVQVEKGIEFLRITERLNSQVKLPMRFMVDANAQWKTEWQTPEGQTDRVRQDGRWYAGMSQPVVSWASAWLAASGEHLDDRPYNLPARIPTRVDLFPRAHDYAEAAVFAPTQSAAAVRILRGGMGLSANPWKPLRADAGIGPVQDRRIGQMSSGVGVWTHLGLDHWNLAGYDQSLSLDYDRETPRHHNSEDVKGRYEVYREFFEGNSNRAELSFTSLNQDVYLDASGRTGRRVEKGYTLKDVLRYSISRGMRVEMGGDIVREKTDQSQPDAATSSLEENQAGFTSALQAESGIASGELQLGMRTITQNIRGDILQGHKSDLALQGQLALAGHTTLNARASVSKYSLDTRSTSNYDDRDELRYNLEAMVSRPFLKTFVYELHGLTQLDHLVYIFRQSSANNRWTRLFLLGSSIRHRPTQTFEQTVTASVSANYQAYDYDLDPRTSRSTVHRRVLLGDSVGFDLMSRFGLSGKVLWQQEEFGRLFWSSFTEERSDQTRSVTASLEMIMNVTRSLQAGTGVLWDSRRGERFPGTSTRTAQLVFQDVRTYGPMVTLRKTGYRGLFLDMNARVLRQFQLEHKTRWVTLGEMVGGFRW
jgi:hypothetical protein